MNRCQFNSDLIHLDKQTKTGNTTVHICDFRREVLNTRLTTRTQHLLPGHKYGQ